MLSSFFGLTDEPVKCRVMRSHRASPWCVPSPENAASGVPIRPLVPSGLWPYRTSVPLSGQSRWLPGYGRRDDGLKAPLPDDRAAGIFFLVDPLPMPTRGSIHEGEDPAPLLGAPGCTLPALQPPSYIPDPPRRAGMITRVASGCAVSSTFPPGGEWTRPGADHEEERPVPVIGHEGTVDPPRSAAPCLPLRYPPASA